MSVSGYKLLVFGYVRRNESKLRLSAVVPDRVIELMITYYRPLKVVFDKFDKTRFIVSENGHEIQSIDTESCSGHLVYAACEYFDGIDSGIHEWSVQSLSSRSGACYQSIGVTQIRPDSFDKKIVSMKSGHWPQEKTRHQKVRSYSSYEGCNRWKEGDIITVVLNCLQWTVTFFRGNVVVKSEGITEGKYFLVFSLCCGKGTVHLKAVPVDTRFGMQRK